MLVHWALVTRTGPAVALLACVISALGSVAAPVCLAQSEKYDGRKIAGIYLEPRDQPLTRDQIGLSLGIRPGDVFDEILLTRAVQRLFATGRYRDIVVDAEPEGDGVTLTFKTVPAFFTSGVRVLGVPDPPSVAKLTSATRLELGAPFDQDTQLPEAVKGLEEVLRANGFYNAKITYSVERRSHSQEADVVFTVEPGARAKFTRPVFRGDPQRPENKLISITKWPRWWGLRGWKEVNEQRVLTGLERLRSHYLKRDHLLASVRLSRLEYDSATNTVRPELEITAGPRVFIRAEGAKVGKGTLRDLIPVYQERTIDTELLMEGRGHLVEHFQARGYFDAKVAYSRTEGQEPGEQRIVYRIDRGSRYKLADVQVRGNSYFGEDTVRERLSIIPARFPQYRRGRFSDDLLEHDKDAILDLYRSNGFRDAAVVSSVEHNYGGKPQEIGVLLTIQEGRQWFVSDVDVSGVDLKLLEEVRGMLSSNPGQPFSIAGVAADRDTVLNWYFNNGYPDASLDVSITPNEETGRVALKYAVIEGRRNFVRDVLVNGLVKTKPELVGNRLALAPGDPLSQSDIVETQRRLYDLGIFAKVDVAVQNPQGLERNKYVLLQAEEARKYSLNLGFGAEFGRIGGGTSNFDAPAGVAGFSPRALIGISRTNFLGLGHTASTTFRISNYQRRVLLNYLAPQFRGNEDVNLTFSSLYDHSRDVRTFTSTRFESAVQVGQRRSRALNVLYRISIRDVEVDEATLNIDPGLIPVFSQPVRVTVFSTSLIHDRRDDPLDSTKGMLNTLDFGYAPGILARRTSYTRLSVRNSTYHRLSRSLVLARTATFGWLYNLESDPVPLPERYYAGGATTHRGFPDNQAGPRDPVTGFPVGGSSFLFFGTELRFPLIGDNLGGVLFHDMGNVYSSASEISFRYKQRDRSDFNYAVQAIGFGVRIKTPVGPIRVDLALAPNSPRFVGFDGTREDLINGTGKFNVPQRVRPFQFHFSIGQSF